ncbi:Cation-transporting ATPase, E1-E2 family [Roseibacterium elongatum DSM 19469]|uniref:Cation-transporting ATPase, E1-E2 family n=1 Tax=Roseicyclus elongatus DSM 19469 TaxID=1294273 RepID=W8RTJ5_9RHOB|nr:cation-transporting P-type ATPase [Roseibacterium elongatum]AHM04539.1 Cation-transporting ATPase, E1-E2 family [Roseibacterium elongatum DSM 19469]
MQEIKTPAPHATDLASVAQRLGTDPMTGLTRDEAASRLSRHGPNRLRRQKRKGWVAILRHQFTSMIVWLLAAASGLSLAFGDIAEGLAIIVVLLINGALGFFTELRAARSMEALMRIAQVRTRVRRDGSERMLDAQDLVPGDIVVLEAGDVVTADLRLAGASNLEIDESILTGESIPVRKQTDAVAPDAAIGDRAGMAYKGTAVTKGAGEGIVVGTGTQTEIGRISDLVQSAESEVAPLERRLDLLGHWLVWLTLALAALTIGAGILRGNEIAAMLQTGVALAVAAVPEGLPVVATLCLARGMWRMSARNALITRLSSVETLGATTIILTDKTGTLTENRMTVMRYLLPDGDVEVAKTGDGTPFSRDGSPLTPETATPLDWALRVGALCSTAELDHGAQANHTGDPMEVALLAVAAKAGLRREALRGTLPEHAKHAFDPDRKMMATVHGNGADGGAERGAIYAVKGAPEAVLEVCTQVMTPDGQVTALPPEAKARWQSRAAQSGQEGLRLLGLAMKQTGDGDGDPYRDLVLLGMVGLRDPLRDGVREAIADCHRAGVRVVMVTGDHADTARAIAGRAGLGSGDLRVIEGRTLAGRPADTLDEAERARILTADVFARVAPDTKLTLVSVFQQAGHVVAMTGDGVNDAPALKKSDIGIAMGQRGTEVAKEAAHMVLRDDAFATITEAMRQGRVIFGNIRKFVVYLMSCNISEVLVVGLAVGGGLPTPLLPLQILYLNLITDVFPAFALGLGRGDDAVMHRPPRDPDEPIVGRPEWQWIATLGAAITVSTLAAFAFALFWLGLDTGAAVTVAFLTLALAQVWNVFNLRDPEAGLLRNEVSRNPYVWGAIALCLALIGLALWQPFLADLLQLESPGMAGLICAGVASFGPLLVGQVLLILRRAR